MDIDDSRSNSRRRSSSFTFISRRVIEKKSSETRSLSVESRKSTSLKDSSYGTFFNNNHIHLQVSADDSVTLFNQKVNLKTFFLALPYSALSVFMVYFNKWILQKVWFAPYTITWLQQLLGLGVFCIISIVEKKYTTGKSGTTHYNNSCFVVEKIRWKRLIQLYPLALSFSGCIAYSNACLGESKIVAYQLARSTTLVTTFFWSYLLDKPQNIKTFQLTSCTLITIGVIIGTFDKTVLNGKALLLGLLSSILQGLYNVLIKTSLLFVDKEVGLLLFYNLLMSILFLIPTIIFSSEIEYILNVGFPLKAMLSVIVSAIGATLLNFVTFSTVKNTSAVTFNVIGIFKSCMQTLFSLVLFDEFLSMSGYAGLALTLCGTYLYGKQEIIETCEEAHKTIISKGNEANPTEKVFLINENSPLKRRRSSVASCLI